jgi:Tfp pilus assembly protein PilF
MVMEQTSIVQKRRMIATVVASGVAVGLIGISLLVASLTTTPAPSDEPAGPATTASAAVIEQVLDSARHSLDTQEPEKAEIVLRAAIDKAPEDQDLRIMYGETLLALGKTRESYSEYEKAIFIGPDHAELRFTAGTIANAAGMTEQSVEHFSMAQSQDPTNAKHPLYLAQIQRKMGDLEAAKASLLRAVKIDPSLDIAWGVLANIALDENNLSLATNHIKRARQLAPSNIQWRLTEARIHRRENHPEDALRLILALDEAQLLADPMLLSEAGLCYGMLRRPADAADLYGRAVERNPENPDLLYEAALWHQRADLGDAAVVYASRAANLGNEAAGRLLANIESDG